MLPPSASQDHVCSIAQLEGGRGVVLGLQVGEEEPPPPVVEEPPPPPPPPPVEDAPDLLSFDDEETTTAVRALAPVADPIAQC